MELGTKTDSPSQSTGSAYWRSLAVDPYNLRDPGSTFTASGSLLLGPLAFPQPAYLLAFLPLTTVRGAFNDAFAAVMVPSSYLFDVAIDAYTVVRYNDREGPRSLSSRHQEQHVPEPRYHDLRSRVSARNETSPKFWPTYDRAGLSETDAYASSVRAELEHGPGRRGLQACSGTDCRCSGGHCCQLNAGCMSRGCCPAFSYSCGDGSCCRVGWTCLSTSCRSGCPSCGVNNVCKLPSGTPRSTPSNSPTASVTPSATPTMAPFSYIQLNFTLTMGAANATLVDKFLMRRGNASGPEAFDSQSDASALATTLHRVCTLPQFMALFADANMGSTLASSGYNHSVFLATFYATPASFRVTLAPVPPPSAAPPNKTGLIALIAGSAGGGLLLLLCCAYCCRSAHAELLSAAEVSESSAEGSDSENGKVDIVNPMKHAAL